MSEEELSQILEEFETVSDIKEFFENHCKNKALQPFDNTLLNKINQHSNVLQKDYTTTISTKNIFGINDDLYENKTPLYLCRHEENMDNALKAFINNPESLFENSSKKQLSFILIKDKNGNKNYFLDSKINLRVIVLIILSDVCESLCLYDINIKEYIL